MAFKKFDDKSLEWKMFADYWELCPKAVELLSDFKGKYKGTFSQKLLIALMTAEDTNKDTMRPVFVDYWRLCQSLWIVELDEKYWENVIKQANDFYNKHKTLFARRLALALTEKLEAEFKEKMKGNSNEKCNQCLITDSVKEEENGEKND